MQYAKATVTAVLLVQIISCSFFDKRPKLAEEALVKQIADESAGYIQLLEFKKLDGKEAEGGTKYIMDFSGFFQYQKDCYKCSGAFSNFLYSNFVVWKSKPEGWDAFNAGVVKPIQKGLKVGYMGKAYFDKKESGWNLYKLEITETKDSGVEPIKDAGGATNEETSEKATAAEMPGAPADDSNKNKVQEDLPPIDMSQLDPDESGDGEEPNLGPNADCDLVGVVTSLNFQGNNYLEIVVTGDGKTSKIWCSGGSTQVFKGDEQVSWGQLQKGMKLCAAGKFETQEGQQQLNAQIISILQ